MTILLTFLFLVFTIFWPLLFDLGQVSYFLSGIMFIVIAFNWVFTGSDLVSYWEGLNIVASAAWRGRFGLGIPIVLVALFGVFILSVCFMFEGIVRGRETSQHRWMKVVSWFGFGLIESRQ